jgi:lipoprotein-anchoring transpeptidase ErfK/SrfK
MVLSSQSGRSDVSSSYMASRRRRRRGGRRLGLVLGFAALLGLIAYYALSPAERGAPASEEPASSGAGADASSQGGERTSPASGPPNAGERTASGNGPISPPPPSPERPSGDGAPEGGDADAQRRQGPSGERDEGPPAGNGLEALVRDGLNLLENGSVVAGRRRLSRILLEEADRLRPAQSKRIRRALVRLSEKRLFSPDPVKDPLVTMYTVERGDRLGRIAPRFDVTYRLIERINRVEARRVRAGRSLKIARGPFHAVVTKSDYRMDIYVEAAARDGEGTPGPPWVYVRSFPVGLGENDSTPEGRWRVREGAKLTNPAWTNPRTGKKYDADDPEKPIGERWIGLRGIGEYTKGLEGYGMHGTIDPNSIGQQVSMGCIRLREDDVAFVYDLLVAGESEVRVRP